MDDLGNKYDLAPLDLIMLLPGSTERLHSDLDHLLQVEREQGEDGVYGLTSHMRKLHEGVIGLVLYLFQGPVVVCHTERGLRYFFVENGRWRMLLAGSSEGEIF